MKADVLCSSRELFGSDRSGVALACVLRDLGVEPTLVLPTQRPERGITALASHHGIKTTERPLAIAGRGGVEQASALVSSRGRPVDLKILNSTAVLGDATVAKRKIVMLREWLNPRSVTHRLLAYRHRAGATAVVAVSCGVLQQWQSCVRGPRRQFVRGGWLPDEIFDTPPPCSSEHRNSILCVGRFNAWKGQDVLADAFEIAFMGSSSRPPLTFLGSQPFTEFSDRARMIARRGSGDGWRVEPFVENPNPYLRRSSLVVVPSLRPEPFGRVLLEGLAQGNRVMAFPGGGPDDLVTRFGDVIQIVPRSTEHLAAALHDWWTKGASPPDEATVTSVRDRLSADFSTVAARSSWDEILSSL